MLPEISLGPVTLYTFGLMSVLGFWIGGLVIGRFLVQLGRPREWAWEMILVAMIGGVLGASIDWALQNGESLTTALEGVFTGGGLVWFGGMIGGFSAFALWAWKRKCWGWEIVATTSFGFLFVQLCGRIGCQLAGDGDYGIPWDGPWAMGYPDGVVPTPPGVKVHPTPIYEALGLGLLIALLWHYRFRLGPQRMVAVWFIGLFLVRFPVEFIRRNPEVFIGLTTAQLVSLLLLVLGLAILLLAQRGKLGPLTFAVTREEGRKLESKT